MRCTPSKPYRNKSLLKLLLQAYLFTKNVNKN